jgi:hypothetical protein
MPSSGMWHRVDILLTDVSEERRFTQDIYGATSLFSGKTEAIRFSEMSVHTIYTAPHPRSRHSSEDFYAAGFDALAKRWDKCINVGGGHVEK